MSAGAAYERRLTVDGEETTLLVLDTWEPEQRVRQGWVLERAGCARGTLYGYKCCLRASERFEGQPGASLSMSGAHRRGARNTHWAKQAVSHLCPAPQAWEAACRVLTGVGSYMITLFKMHGNGLGMGVKDPTG